jgi:hypothetical protein
MFMFLDVKCERLIFVGTLQACECAQNATVALNPLCTYETYFCTFIHHGAKHVTSAATCILEVPGMNLRLETS